MNLSIKSLKLSEQKADKLVMSMRINLKPSRTSVPIQGSIAQSKFRNDSTKIRNLTLQAMLRMHSPLIATHFRPDEDGIGSAIALAIHLRNRGNSPVIFLRKGGRVPRLLAEIIKTEGLTIAHVTNSRLHDGLIMVDTAGRHLLEESIQSLLDTNIARVDIDHHLGEEIMTPVAHSLISDRVSSTSELIAGLLGKDVSANMARALLAGILCDTKNLHFMMGDHTRITVQRLAQLAKVEVSEFYVQLREINEADRILINRSLDEVAEASIKVTGRQFNVQWVVIREQDLINGARNWLNPLQEEIGFGRKADIVLIVYYDNNKGEYRGSLSAYGRGTVLDFRPTAERISKGGGHPGGVGFDFPLEDFADNAAAINAILNILIMYGRLK